MHVGYVVLYVKDVDACVNFWTNQVGMSEHDRKQIAQHSVVRVGFGHQNFSFELVPLAMMNENPDGLDLATPSVCFYADDLEAEHKKLTEKSVALTEIGEHFGMTTFAFCDNEGRWFAVAKA